MKKAIIYICMTAAMAFIIAGCGASNDDNVFSSTSDEAHYQDNWLETKHSEAAVKDLEGCMDCHGDDFEGGISNTACTTCHLGDAINMHPVDWGDKAYAKHYEYIKNTGYIEALLSCNDSYCHGEDWLGGDTGPSCRTCHMGGVGLIHPISDVVVWAKGTEDDESHATYVKSNGISSCALASCHGVNLEGVAETGMSCISCHQQNW